MFTVQNLKKILLAVLLTTAVSYLCTVDVEGGKRSSHGTRVNVGGHSVGIGGGLIRMVVLYVNVSNEPININQINIYRPDGTLESPDFSSVNFPIPPFELGPFESKALPLFQLGLIPVITPGSNVFQVHTTWKSRKSHASLQSYSVILTLDQSDFRVLSKHTVEGFDLK